MCDVSVSSSWIYKKTIKKHPKKKKPKKKSKLSASILKYDNIPRQAFEWIVAPLQLDTLFKLYWQKAPFKIMRSEENYYKQIMATRKLVRIVRNNVLFYTDDVDVISYRDEKTETLNLEGPVSAALLSNYYENGYGIKILTLPTYSKNVRCLVAALQEYFGCVVGVNAYLTPPGSQDFVPRNDGFEAFVLQLEGRKHWKLYASVKEDSYPRFSSLNFDRWKLQNPLYEVSLKAGDMIYLPRGTIYQGYTDDDSYSFHITISLYQRTAYADLMEHTLKQTLAAAVQDDWEFRESLPLHYLKHVGSANAGSSSEVKSEIMTKAQKLFDKMMQYVSVDAGADEMGKQFIWDAIPPVRLRRERLCMVRTGTDNKKMFNGNYIEAVKHLELKVRLLRYYCLRITPDENIENSVRICYSAANAKYYHSEEQQYIVIDKEFAPAVFYLLHNYPKFVTINSLPLVADWEKFHIVSTLWGRGLLVTEKPL